MTGLLAWPALLALAAAGLAALARPKWIADGECEAMKGKGSAAGNALQSLQEIFEPGRAEHLRKARVERRAEQQPGGDAPDPER